jgi:hypothetical protein
MEFGMSHQDRTSKMVVNHQTLKQVVDWLLAPTLFAGLHVRRGATWAPRMLAAAALLWATGEQCNLTDRFVTARKIVAKIFRWRTSPGQTYQGFLKMLHTWHSRLLPVITTHLRLQMQEALPGQWTIAGFVIFAGDGSRVELPRTASLEKAFSPQRKKNQNKFNKKKNRKHAGTTAKQRRHKRQAAAK